MAELDAGLGEYFKVERGVLILKATDDNRLQLKSGDVILKVGGTEVATPGDVVRALRDVESGSQVELDIKRERKNRTLQVAIPENRVGLLLRDDS
jgi:S1-C subfamily serine protease